jgi:hypothetical protein
MSFKIYDQNGAQKDAAWLKATYGNVQVTEATVPTGAAVFRVAELREKVGPATLIAQCRLPDGSPIKNVPIVRYWPGAPTLPTWEPPPERWRDRGVSGRTNNEGNVGFGMGNGDYYRPDSQEGASAIWCGKPSTHSDLVSGLGMLVATNHAHIDTIFELAEGPPGPEPGPEPPEPGDDSVVLSFAPITRRLDRIIDLLEDGTP